MTTISKLAQFVSETSFDSLPSDTVKNLKLHLFDTIGAMLAGPRTVEGIATGNFVPRLSSGCDVPVIGYPMNASLLVAVMTTCAATRCTEIDDIHLGSCITPGSIVIPTALSLAHAGYFTDPRDFLVGLTIGYELLIRLGVAIDGPNILYQGIWPTYMAAPLGSAAVTAKALKLSATETANALACAIAMSTGIAGRTRKALSSRWLTLGIAAQNGVMAAFSAKEGFAGDDALLDREKGPLSSRVANNKLLEGMGDGFFIDETGMKPYPVARQALAAVEAFREIISTHKINPDSIEKVMVFVPGQFTTMIDKAMMPESRLESIVSVQYQISVAALEPACLMDVKREPLLQDRRISSMMEKILVKRSPELEVHFPRTWPARVEVITKEGAAAHEVLHPKGDQENPFSWDEVASKFEHAAAGSIYEARMEQIGRLVRTIDTSASLRPLLESLT